jgi:hypothetical protein
VWLDVFHPTPEDVWTALADLATGALPTAVADALRARSLHLSPSDKFALAQVALDDPERSPSPEFLRAIRFSEAAPVKVAAAITRVAAEATTATQREGALILWGEFKPTGLSTQEGLINDVYLPQAKRGGEDLDIAVSHFGLVSGQRGKLRNAIIDALTNSASDDQRQRIEDRLKEAGWLKRGGLLGRGAVVKVDEDK